jgi:hypothetical protein
MKAIAYVVTGLLMVTSSSATERCSIHPPQQASPSQLAALAKISRRDAERAAIAALHSHGAVTVSSAELESEHGCLIWSFDLKQHGETGIEEVQIDAGDAALISVKHETVRQERVEAARDGTDG